MTTHGCQIGRDLHPMAVSSFGRHEVGQSASLIVKNLQLADMRHDGWSDNLRTMVRIRPMSILDGKKL